MAKFEDVVQVIKKDTMLGKLMVDVKREDTLSSIGFDSLDVMMTSHELGVEFNIELEITKNHTLDEIVALINSKVTVK